MGGIAEAFVMEKSAVYTVKGGCVDTKCMVLSQVSIGHNTVDQKNKLVGLAGGQVVRYIDHATLGEWSEVIR
jgi:hypothetical protein